MNMTKFARIGLAFLAFGAAPGLATAQDTFADSHLAAARSVAIEAKVLEPFNDVLPLLMQQTRTAFIQSNPTLAEDIVEVTEEVALDLAARRIELNTEIYRIWAGLFSEEELLELAAFYQTPLGKKLRDQIPTITARTVAAGREWQDKISVDMVALVQDELNRRLNGEP